MTVINESLTLVLMKRAELEVARDYLNVVKERLKSGGEPNLANRVSALMAEVEMAMKKGSTP